MTEMQNNYIDDIFTYKSKMSFLLLLLFLGLIGLIFGLSNVIKIKENERKIFAQEYFILRMNDLYNKAKKIVNDSNFGKIDYLKLDELLKAVDTIKKFFQKYGILELFKLDHITTTKPTIQKLTIKFSVTLTSKEDVIDMWKKLVKLNILDKKINITYKNGKWKFDGYIDLYYKGKLSKELIKKFKEKEIDLKKNRNDKNKK